MKKERERCKIFIRRLIPDKPEISETKLTPEQQKKVYKRIKAKATEIHNKCKTALKIKKYNRAMEVVRGEKKDTGK